MFPVVFLLFAYASSEHKAAVHFLHFAAVFNCYDASLGPKVDYFGLSQEGQELLMACELRHLFDYRFEEDWLLFLRLPFLLLGFRFFLLIGGFGRLFLVGGAGNGGGFIGLVFGLVFGLFFGFFGFRLV